MTASSIRSRLLSAVLGLGLVISGLAGCSVSESGTVPCADSANCPKDYPVCDLSKGTKGLGVCVEGTSGNTGATSEISISGVSGPQVVNADKTAFYLRGSTLRVTVSAKSTAGIRSVSLKAGATAAAAATDGKPPAYTFTIDTGALADGDIAADGKLVLTASLVPGADDATAPTPATTTITLTRDFAITGLAVSTAPSTGVVAVGTVPTGRTGATLTASATLATPEVTAANPPVFTFTDSAGHAFQLPAATVSSSTLWSSSYSFAANGTEAAGLGTVQVAVTDASGFVPAAVARPFALVRSSGVVAITGLAGHAATDVVRKTVQVAVAATDAIGIKSVTLAGAAGITPVAGSTYSFDLDTLVAATSTASLVATLTTLDNKTYTSTPFTVAMDNAAPALSGSGAAGALALSLANVQVGQGVTLDVNSSEKLATIAVTAQLGSNAVIPFTQVSATSSGAGTAYKFAFGATDQTPPGTYAVNVTAADLAGNTASAGPFTFSIGAQFSAPIGLVAHQLPGGAGPVLINGLVAATTGDTVAATVTKPAGISFAPGYPQYTVTDPDGNVTTPVTQGDFSSSFLVNGTSAVKDGIYTYAAVVKSTTDTTTSSSKQFIVQRVAPKVVGDAAGISVSPAFVGPSSRVVTVTFSTDSVPFTRAVKVGASGAAAQLGTASAPYLYQYTLTNADLPANTVAALPVQVTIADNLGNTTTVTNNTAAQVDTKVPTIATHTLSNKGVAGTSAVVQLSFSLDDGAGKIGAAAPTVTVTPKGGTANPAALFSRTDTGGRSAFVFQYTVSGTDSDGPADVTIDAVDAAANALAQVKDLGVFKIDRTSPTLAGLALTPLLGEPGATTVVQSQGGIVNVTVNVGDCSLAAAPKVTFTDSTGAVVDAGNLSGTLPVCASGAPPAVPTAYTFAHTVGTNRSTGAPVPVTEAAGQVSVTVSATDLAGNIANQTAFYTVDNTAPALLGSSTFVPVQSNDGATTLTIVATKKLAATSAVKVKTGATVIADGGAFQGSAVSIKPAAGQTFPCSTCRYAITGLVPSSAATATFSAVVTMNDTVANANTATADTATITALFPVAVTYTVDTVLPAISGPSLAVAPATCTAQTATGCTVVKKGQQVQITGTATKALKSVKVFTSNGDAQAGGQSCTFDAQGNFTCVLSVSEASTGAAVTTSVVLTDTYNNASAALAAGGYVVDNQSPDLTAFVVGTPDNAGAPGTVGGTALFKAGATMAVSVNARDCNFAAPSGTVRPVTAVVNYLSNAGGAPVSTAMTLAAGAPSASCSTGATLIFTHLVAANEPNGAITVTVQAQDQAGNSSSVAGSYQVNNAAPALVSYAFSPSVSFDGNSSVTLTFAANVTGLGIKLRSGGVNYGNGECLTAGCGAATVTIASTSASPCSVCSFSLGGLKKTGSIVNDWTPQVVAGQDLFGNTLGNAGPTSASTPLTVDGVSTGFQISFAQGATPTWAKKGGSLTFVGTAGIGLQSAALTTCLTANPVTPTNTPACAGASGDTAVCSVGANNKVATCVVTLSSTEGYRASTVRLVDANGNAAPAPLAAPTYVVDGTPPDVALAFTGGVVDPDSGLPLFSGVSTVVGNQSPSVLLSLNDNLDTTAAAPTQPVAVSLTAVNAGSGSTLSNFALTGSLSVALHGNAPGVNTYTHSLSGESTGVTVVTALVTDQSGNSASATRSYQIDNTVPAYVGSAYYPAASNTQGVIDTAGNLTSNQGTFTFAFVPAKRVKIALAGATTDTIYFTSGATSYFHGSASPSGSGTVSITTTAGTTCAANLECKFTVSGLTAAAATTFAPVVKLNDLVAHATVVLAGPTFTSDQVAPVFTALAAAPAYVSTLVPAVTVTGAVSPGFKKIASATFTTSAGGESGGCSIDNTAAGSSLVSCTFNTALGVAGPTTVAVTVNVVDTSGNPGTGTTTVANSYVVDNSALTVAGTPAVSPAIVGAGQSVTITGAVNKFASTPRSFAPLASAALQASASIQSGSCVTTPGTSVGSPGTFTCTARLANAATANFNASILLTDLVGNSTTATGAVVVNNSAATIASFTLGTGPSCAAGQTASLTLVSGATSTLRLCWGALGGGAFCSANTPCYIYSSADPAFAAPITSMAAGGVVTTGSAPLGNPVRSTTYTLVANAYNGTSASQTATLFILPTLTAPGLSITPITQSAGNASVLTTAINGANCGNGLGSAAATGCSILSSEPGATPQALTCTGGFAGNLCTVSYTATPAAPSLGPVTYTVTAWDANGASAQTSATLTVLAAPVIQSLTGPGTISDDATGTFSLAFTLANVACGSAAAPSGKCKLADNAGVALPVVNGTAGAVGLGASGAAAGSSTFAVPVNAGFSSTNKPAGTVFTLTATNGATDGPGTLTSTVTVNSVAVPPAGPTLSIGGGANFNMTAGDTGNLSFAYTAVPTGVTARLVGGSVNVTLAAPSSTLSNATVPKTSCGAGVCTYTVTYCNAANSCSSASATVTVLAPAAITGGLLNASARTISAGNQLTFTLPTVTGATTCTLTQTSGAGGAIIGSISGPCIPTPPITTIPTCATTPSCANVYTLTFSNGVAAAITSTVSVEVYPQPTLTSGAFNVNATGLAITAGDTGTFNATLPVFAAAASQFRITGAGTAFDSGWNQVTGAATFAISKPSVTTVYSLQYANALFNGATTTTCDSTTGCVAVAGGANQTVTVVPAVTLTGSLSVAAATVPAGVPFTLTLPQASASSVSCALTAVTTNGGTAGSLPALNGDCTVGGGHTTSASLTPACSAAAPCVSTYTLTYANSVGTTYTQTLVVTAVPAPATAGNLSGPVVAVSGSTITLAIPAITNANTVVVKANGTALPVGNLLGAASVQTPMPAVKTTYTLWASNPVNASAQLGASVIVLSAASATQDTLPKAVYGAASVLLDATAHAALNGKVLILGGFSDVAPYAAGAVPAGTALSSAWLFDPATNSLTLVGASVLTTPRVMPGAVLLTSGKVLVAGGNMTAASSLFELVDTTLAVPTSAAIGGDTTSRCLAPLVGPMSNGRYLLTGGTDCTNDTAVNIWKTINPLSGAPSVTSGGNGFSGTAPLALARSWHTATKLTGDVVVLAGGRDALVGTNSMELVQYNPTVETSTTFGLIGPSGGTGLSVARYGHTATRYPPNCTATNTCKVLFAGGAGTATADVYTEPVGAIAFPGNIGALVAAGAMSAVRFTHGAVRLDPTGAAPVASGLILVAGGFDGASPLATTELFDPGTNAFVAGPALAMKRQEVSVVVGSAAANTALIVGGTAATSGGVANATYPTLLEQVTLSP